MISKYEDEVVCDIAETYGIYDYRALSPEMAATLVIGLPVGSRVYKKITGSKVSDEITMLANILDATVRIGWMMTKDGARGRNRPKSVAKELAREVEKGNIKSFDSMDDFKRAWNGN